MLTDARIRKIKPEEKTKRYTDEKGMYLEVTPSGGMYWRLKYRINGKENRYSMGVYGEVSLLVQPFTTLNKMAFTPKSMSLN